LICHLRSPSAQSRALKSLIDAHRSQNRTHFWAICVDVLKKREGARETPGGSGGAQATWNTGPVIRIAIAKRREKLIMAWLLAEIGAGIKRLVRFAYILKSKR
jgi:hypothetical protein